MEVEVKSLNYGPAHIQKMSKYTQKHLTWVKFPNKQVSVKEPTGFHQPRGHAPEVSWLARPSRKEKPRENVLEDSHGIC